MNWYVGFCWGHPLYSQSIVVTYIQISAADNVQFLSVEYPAISEDVDLKTFISEIEEEKWKPVP